MSLGRWALGGLVATSMTATSLWIVAAMNDDPAPPPPESTSAGARTVPVAPPPPPPPQPLAPNLDPVSSDAPQTTPAQQLTPPKPAPAQVAGLAPSTGPGTIGITGGTLPSMGTLPGASLPATDAAPQTSTAARPRSRPKPRYPRLAQRQGIEGFVTVRLRIDAAGHVEDVIVVEANPPGVFDDAAIQTARRYRFSPAMRGNEAVSSTLQQTIRFELQR